MITEQWKPGPYEPGKYVQDRGFAYKRTDHVQPDECAVTAPHLVPRSWRNLGRMDQIEALQLAEVQLRIWCQVYPSTVEEEDNYALEAIRSALRGIDGEEETGR